MKIRFSMFHYAVTVAFALCANAVVSAQTVTSFTLVNADTGADIATFTDSGTVVLARTPRINIRANAVGARSVVFTDGVRTRTEKSQPFAYLGNNGPIYNKWSPAPGTYVINARPLGQTGKGQSGSAGTSATLTLNVIEDLVPETLTFDRTSGPDKNPLKGWCSGWGNKFPEASVGFQYVPWKTFEPQNNLFDKNAVESILSRPGTSGKHLILRFYAQWAGAESEIDQLAAPSWLFTQQNVPFLMGEHSRTGDPRSLIDFNDANYIRESRELIRALAAAYDNDPRVYAIQIGMLGYWGEWHTHAFSMEGERYELATESGLGIVDAFAANFSNKHLMGRYPWREPLKSTGRIGFHNDFFKAYDGHSNEFDFAIHDGLKWIEGPIGGEVPPLKGDLDPLALYVDPDVATSMIETGHYSTMQPGLYRRIEGEPNRDEYMRLHRLMGYNFQIDQAIFPTEIVRGGSFPVVLEGVNIGVAPFYYDWDVEFALLDQSNKAVATAKVPARLSEILPEDKFHFESSLNVGGDIQEGVYRIAVRISQPGASTNKTSSWKLDATNVCVQFANKLEFAPPFWNDQHALSGGWSVLENVYVTQ